MLRGDWSAKWPTHSPLCIAPKPRRHNTSSLLRASGRTVHLRPPQQRHLERQRALEHDARRRVARDRGDARRELHDVAAPRVRAERRHQAAVERRQEVAVDVVEHEAHDLVCVCVQGGEGVGECGVECVVACRWRVAVGACESVRERPAPRRTPHARAGRTMPGTTPATESTASARAPRSAGAVTRARRVLPSGKSPPFQLMKPGPTAYCYSCLLFLAMCVVVVNECRG